mgnify:CR=1 FL=1
MKMKSANCSVGEHAHCSGIFKTTDRENLDTSWSCECGCHRKSGEPQAEASEKEPMNMRMFEVDRTFYLRGFGYTGNGSTPEDAMRDFVMHRNAYEDNWPVRKFAGQPLPPVEPDEK